MFKHMFEKYLTSYCFSFFLNNALCKKTNFNLLFQFMCRYFEVTSFNIWKQGLECYTQFLVFSYFSVPTAPIYFFISACLESIKRKNGEATTGPH